MLFPQATEIAGLRGERGALSRMTLPQLEATLEVTARALLVPSASERRSGGQPTHPEQVLDETLPALRAEVEARRMAALRRELRPAGCPVCPVCKDAIPDRVMRPCGHVFCRECVAVLEHGLGVPSPKRCPVCRDPFAGFGKVFF